MRKKKREGSTCVNQGRKMEEKKEGIKQAPLRKNEMKQ